MIASKMFDMVMGVDIHIIQPPGPVPPVPIPHPFIGMVLDPMEFLPFIGASVYVNGIPRTQAGSEVKAVPPHIPIGGTFIKPIGNEGEIFMGSATVLAEDEPLSRMAMPVLSCSCIGMPPPPRPTKKPEAGMMLPTSILMAVPGGGLVMVGGPPTVSLMAVGMKVGMGALKMLKGTKKWKKMSDSIHEFAEKKFKNKSQNFRNKMHSAICAVTGHPVDIATGKVFTDATDFELPGPIPMSWERKWLSVSDYEGPLGFGWHHTYDLSVQRTSEYGNVELRLADGRNLYFPWLAKDEVFYNRQEKLTITSTGEHLVVEDASHLRQVYEIEKIDHLRPHRVRRIENSVGDAIVFDYDRREHLTGITDSAGRKLQVETDDLGRILSILAPYPREGQGDRTFPLVRYRYDGAGDLVRMIDPLDAEFSYRYQNHLLVQETDRNGLSFYFEYDGRDENAWCLRTWGDEGIYDHKLIYDREKKQTIVENSLGHRTLYLWNDDGLVWKTVDPLGHETLTRWGAYGNMLMEVDELQRVTRYEYDDNGNRTLIVYPDGSKLEMSYLNHQLIAATDQNGGSWAWVYDDKHRLIQRTDCAGSSTRYGYEDGLLRRIIDPIGGETSLDFDEQKNLIGLTTPDGATSNWQYDRLGRMIVSTDPRGNEQKRALNLLGNIIRVKEPDGNTRELTYDGEENILRAKDEQYDVRFEYKGMNRLGARIEAGTRVEFKYNTEEDLVGIINEHGYAYRFELDARGDVVTESGFDRLTRQYERDPAGQVAAVLRPGERRTDYAYDKLGRVMSVNHWDGSAENYEYRADGELLVAQNNAIKVEFERDPIGRVLVEKQGGFEVKSAYDSLGNRTSIQSSLGADVRIDRNEMGDVQSVKSATAEADDPWSVHFERDLLGLEMERSLPGGVRSRWQRDRLGRPIKQETSAGGQRTRSRKYKWGMNDRLQEIFDDQQGRFLFEHDSFGNLAAATYPDGSRELRMPDAVGNLFRRSDQSDREYGPAGQLLKAEGTVFEYDPEGNMIAKIRPDGSQWRYEWNAAGMLARVIRPDGKIVYFTYDALGRRIAKRYGRDLTRWVWDGNLVLHEWREEAPPAPLRTVKTSNTEPEGASGKMVIRRRREKIINEAQVGETESGSPIAEGQKADPAGGRLPAGTEVTTWLFEPETFAPLAKLTPNQDYGIVTDYLGTPVGMYNESGEQVWSLDLSIYGNVRKLDGWRGECPFRYPGQYEDVETGLYYNRFRYYDPEVGGYVSQDPIGLFGGGRLTAYVPDVNIYVDPFGLAKKKGDCGSYSTVGGHHVHGKAAFKSNSDYSKYKAFCLGQDWMKKNGLDHNAMTKKQRELFDKLADDVAKGTKKNTLAEHDRIAKEALIAGGATNELADSLVSKSSANLASQGVTSPSNIPWN